ncbi:hypothetical protein Hanom_Chr09g00836291 [Helianthus anomalus]
MISAKIWPQCPLHVACGWKKGGGESRRRRWRLQVLWWISVGIYGRV